MEDVKLARYDRVFDSYARDGYLTREGFERHVSVLAELQGRSPDSPALVAFQNELFVAWEALAANADADGDGRVNRDEWRAAAEGITASLLESKRRGEPWAFDNWVRVLYGAIDGNGDGMVTQEEYLQWLTALGLADDTDLDSAFAGFDTNQDGSLSMEEFTRMYHEYWSVFDPSLPSHRWIGP